MATERPIYEHDCASSCIFLGSFSEMHGAPVDLYFCRQGKGKSCIPTVLSRYGHEPQEYNSGSETSRVGAIAEGWARAKERALTDCKACKMPRYGMGVAGCHDQHVTNLLSTPSGEEAYQRAWEDARKSIVYECEACGAQYPTQGYGSSSRPCVCGRDAYRRCTPTVRSPESIMNHWRRTEPHAVPIAVRRVQRYPLLAKHVAQLLREMTISHPDRAALMKEAQDLGLVC